MGQMKLHQLFPEKKRVVKKAINIIVRKKRAKKVPSKFKKSRRALKLRKSMENING